MGLVLAACAWPQAVDPKLTFEVATVKVAPPVTGPVMMGGRGGPGSRDPGRFSTTNLPLKMLLARAYGVKDYQVSGPSWLDTERFDITAKVPEGTTPEQFNVMLQNLLIERLKIELHHETKELPIFTLTVAKGGAKLKETTLDPSAFAPPPMSDGAGRGGNASVPAPPPPPQPGQFPKLPEGRPGMIMMFNGAKLMATAAGQTMSNIVDFLARQLGRPVVDKTGLTAKYDFQLEFAMEMGQGPMRGMPPPMPPPGAGPGGGDAPTASDPAPNLVTAVQQLGLKLDSGKGPVQIVVIDKAEKTPIEN